jgi:hypothetical protein
LGLSQRTAQNWGDRADYGTDVALGLIPFLGPLSKARKAGKTLKVAKTAGRIASAKVKEKVEVKLRQPPPAEGERRTERIRDTERMLRDRNRFAERGEARVTHGVQGDPRVRMEYRTSRSERGERFYADNPEMLQRFRGRVSRSDVDHRLDLQLGGQDIRSNMVFRESGVNRSFGSQTQHQTQGLTEGTRIRRFTLERPPQGE